LGESAFVGLGLMLGEIIAVYHLDEFLLDGDLG